MENLKSAITLMKPNCYMATLDLKDAYYSVSINNSERKYLRFIWNKQLFQFTCLPNGLSCAPRLFTKLMKPVYSYLRCKGWENVGYIDDTYLQGSDSQECENNISETVTLFKELGFSLNETKSDLTPRQTVKFLGFYLNSVKMTVSITPEKANKILIKSQKILEKASPSIRDVSELIGLMVASFPGVMYGPLYYRQLEIEKTIALKQNKGDYNANMKLTENGKLDIKWWIENITNTYNVVTHGNCETTIYSDASLTGWGGVLDNTSSGGKWSEIEADNHINYLEILACFLTLKTFCPHMSHCHIKAMIDNTTAISYVNNMGGKTPKCNKISKELWEWCAERSIWVTAVHIPGKENYLADKESRAKNRDVEWKLDCEIFQLIVFYWYKPSVDLFASRLNYQMKPFVSWKPDPEAIAFDAFVLDWSMYNQFYAFPPFSLINRVLQKIEQDQTQGIVVVPLWKTQVWFPRLLHLLIDIPLILPKTKTMLILPSNPKEVHPLNKKLTLLACKLSGIPLQAEEFRRKLQKSSCNHGGQAQNSNTQSISGNGVHFVVQGALIHTKQI